MTFDQYNALMQGIYGELAEISKRTQDMAKVGVAKSGHPPFDNIMARQDQLIQEARRLTDSLLPVTKNVRTYGKKVFEKDGFAMVEVWHVDPTGQNVFIGYAILNPEGEEIDFCKSYDDALAAIQKLTHDNDSSPGYEP